MGSPLSQTKSPERQLEQSLVAFCERSNSTETRRAYERVAREFFQFCRWREPREITSEMIRDWRDHLKAARKKPATIRQKLAIVRALFEYLREEGKVTTNPATPHKVPPPAAAEGLRGRALTAKEVRRLLTGPDRSRVEGARDYALLLLLVRTGMRVSEACSLKSSSLSWSHGRWLLKVKVKGGRERKLPLPKEIKEVIAAYLELDRPRRSLQHSDGTESWLFQPLVNYRTLEFDKGLSTTHAWKIVRRWGEFTGLGKVSPHDLRRTAITRALDQGLTHRQVRMMSGHKSLEMVLRYDHNRENLELNAVNFLDYGEEASISEPTGSESTAGRRDAAAGL